MRHEQHGQRGTISVRDGRRGGRRSLQRQIDRYDRHDWAIVVGTWTRDGVEGCGEGEEGRVYMWDPGWWCDNGAKDDRLSRQG